MGEYETVISTILDAHPEITRADLDAKIDAKMKAVGNGYLTQSGAAHLVAGELKVKISKAGVASDLKDAYTGAKEISLRTRVMNVSSVRKFTGKDGSQGAIRTMIVYDNDQQMSVKLWNDKAVLPEIDQIKPGDMIKIIKAYVKEDRDGTPAINIGTGATLERDADQSTDIGGLETIEIDIDAVTDDTKNAVVAGILDGAITDSTFTRKTDGKPGSMLRLSLKGKNGTLRRVVLWGKTKSDLPKFIPVGARMRIVGADARQGNGGLELHGNDATILNIPDQKSEIPPMPIRIISKSGTRVLGVNADSHFVFITDSANKTAEFAPDDMVEVVPTSAFGSSISLDADAFVRRIGATDAKISTREELYAKIGSIKAGETYIIKGIALKTDEPREIQTRSGDTVMLAEMYVEDSTGQAWVKGWREQADVVSKCTPGEVYEISGLNARPGQEGRVDLMLTAYSTVKKQD